PLPDALADLEHAPREQACDRRQRIPFRPFSGGPCAHDPGDESNSPATRDFGAPLRGVASAPEDSRGQLLEPGRALAAETGDAFEETFGIVAGALVLEKCRRNLH